MLVAVKYYHLISLSEHYCQWDNRCLTTRD